MAPLLKRVVEQRVFTQPLHESEQAIADMQA